MVAKRATLLGLLMLFINTAIVHSHASQDDDSYGLTPEQEAKLSNIETPACMKMCQDEKDKQNEDDHYIPLCASESDDETESSMKEGYQCLCTDRRYVESIVSCYVKNCASNSTAFDIALTSQYGICFLYGDVGYPKPAVFLNDLCLLDDLPEKSVPTDLKLLMGVWPDYKFAQDFPPELAHTTTLPDNSTYTVPAWTCTPTPISSTDVTATPTAKPTDANSTAKSESADATPTTTTKPKNGTTNTSDHVGEAEGRRVLMGMTAVVAAVAGLAVLL